MKIAVVLSLCLCSVRMSLGEARPKLPSSQYGVPSSGYGRGPVGYDGESAGYGRGPVGYGRGPAGFHGRLGGGEGGYNDPLAQDANYMFMYEVQDAASGNDFGHMEQRQGEVARGSYHVLLPDGRAQRVDYVVDQEGYKTVISYTGTLGRYNDPPSQDDNYMLMYEAQDAASGKDFGHMEENNFPPGDKAQGAFQELQPDGLLQTVEYFADPEEYNPVVTFSGSIGGGAMSGF